MNREPRADRQRFARRVDVNASIHIHTHARAHVRTPTCAHTRTLEDVCTHTRMHACTLARIHSQTSYTQLRHPSMHHACMLENDEPAARSGIV